MTENSMNVRFWVLAIGLCAGVFALAVLAAADLMAAKNTKARRAPNKVLGPNSCAECHAKEADAWKASHHFATFNNMPRSKAARDIANKMKIKRIKSQSLCLNCHFTVKGGVKKRGKPIAGISCESCHGAGRDWEKPHSAFSGKKKKTESKTEAAARWAASERAGMIRPKALYRLAKNCYGCHVVPQEELVNKGGHPAGSAFELLSWSQGEVRHNLWYSDGKENKQANSARKRMLFVMGAIVELETALRAVGVATQSKRYAYKMALRADAARKRLKVIAAALPSVTPLQEISKLSYAAGLKLNNNKALTRASDGIAAQARTLAKAYDGSKFRAIDAMLPGGDKYKGKPFK